MGSTDGLVVGNEEKRMGLLDFGPEQLEVHGSRTAEAWLGEF